MEDDYHIQLTFPTIMYMYMGLSLFFGAAALYIIKYVPFE